MRVDGDNLFLVGGYTRERLAKTAEEDEYDEDEDYDMMEDDEEAENSLVKVGVSDPLWMFNISGSIFVKMECSGIPSNLLIQGCDAVVTTHRNAFHVFGTRGAQPEALCEYQIYQSIGNEFLTVESDGRIINRMLFNHPVLHDSAIAAGFVFFLGPFTISYRISPETFFRGGKIKIQRSVVVSNSSNYLQAMLSGSWSHNSTEDGLPVAGLPEFLQDYEYEFEGLLNLVHGIEDPIDPDVVSLEGSLQERSVQCCTQAINIAILAEQLSMIELPQLLYRRIGIIIMSKVATHSEAYTDASLFAKIFQDNKEPEEMSFKMLREFISIDDEKTPYLVLSYAKRLIHEHGYVIPEATYALIFEKYVGPHFEEYRAEMHAINAKKFPGSEEQQERAKKAERRVASEKYRPIASLMVQVYDAGVLANRGDITRSDRLYNTLFPSVYVDNKMNSDAWQPWYASCLGGARLLVHHACNSDADSENPTGYWTIFHKFHAAQKRANKRAHYEHTIEEPTAFLKLGRQVFSNSVTNLLLSVYEASHSKMMQSALDEALPKVRIHF
jgi:hypothetical protein